MSIVYADVDLTPPHDGQAMLERYWHGHRIEEFEYSAWLISRLLTLPIPYPPQREPPRIGALTWPTGASNWSTCHLVATGQQLNNLREDLGTSPIARDLVFDDGTNEVTTKMWMLPPRPISQRGDSKEFYLITLVDERWWWFFGAGDQQVPTTINSWDQLLDDLFTSLGVSADNEGVDPAYLTPDQDRWDVGYQPLPLVIDAICKTVGMRVVRGLDGQVRIVSATTANTDDSNRWEIINTEVLAGGRITADDIARSLPDSVAVIFPDGSDNPQTVTITLASLLLPDFDGTTGVAGEVGRVTADHDPQDATFRNTYAAQAAKDFYLWALSPTDCTVRLFYDADPVGNDLFVEWVHTPDTMVTRIVRPPWTDINVWGDASAGPPCEPTVYKDECQDGFLVRLKATACNPDDAGAEPTFEFDQDLGVPCFQEEPGSGGEGSGGGGSGGPPVPDFPVQFDSVSNICPPTCGLPKAGHVIIKASGDTSEACYEELGTVTDLPGYSYYKLLETPTFTVEKRSITVEAFGNSDEPQCSDATDNCCEQAGSGSGEDTSGICCPCDDAMSLVPFSATGPMGIGCHNCTITGNLGKSLSSPFVWEIASQSQVGCGTNYIFDWKVYCESGSWFAEGEIAHSVNPGEIQQSGHFNVLLDSTTNPGFLTGHVQVPGCPGTLLLTITSPCSETPCSSPGGNCNTDALSVLSHDMALSAATVSPPCNATLAKPIAPAITWLSGPVCAGTGIELRCGSSGKWTLHIGSTTGGCQPGNNPANIETNDTFAVNGFLTFMVPKCLVVNGSTDGTLVPVTVTPI